MSQPSVNTGSEVSPANDESTIFEKLFENLKRISLFTTVGDDLNQAQNAACIKALKAYGAGSRDLLAWDEDTETQYNLINELAIRLKRFNEKLAEEGLPPRIESLLARKVKDYETVAQAFNEGLCPTGRLLWAIFNATQVAFSLWGAITGPERALIPTELPQAWRTILVLTQYLSNPATENWQQLEITLQRSLMLLPNLIGYILSFKLHTYGTAVSTWSSAGGSLAFVSGVIALHEGPGYWDRRTLKKYVASLASDNAPERAPQLPTNLQTEIDEIKEVQLIVDEVISSFELGNAAANQSANLRTAANAVFNSTDTVIQGRVAEKPKNIHRREKYYIVGMGDILILAVLGASARNPSVLVANLRWAAYYHYKLTSSAENPAHNPEHTMELFGMAGAMMIFGVPLVSAVLIIGGKDYFEDERRLVGHTAAMMVAQSTVVHRVGPALLSARKWLLRKWRGDEDLTQATERFEHQIAALEDELRSVAEILGQFSDRSDEFLEALSQRPTMPSLTEILEPFLARLDEYDRGTKNESEPRARSRGKAPDTGIPRAPSPAARGPADLVDLLSAFEIVGDTAFLQDRMQAEEVADFAELKSIMMSMTSPDPLIEKMMKVGGKKE